MKLAVINSKGEDTGRKVDLKKEIFGIEPNEHAVYLDVKHHLAKQRQGTHKTKGRSEIVGSTRKIKKQKGTGTARAGSIKSGILRGGGTMFGPTPRDHSFKLNKKIKKLARKSVLSDKAKEKQIKVLEDLQFEQPKTKEMVGVLKNLALDVDKALFVVQESVPNLSLSVRNIPNAKAITVNEMNTYDLINADYLIFSEGSIEAIHNALN